MLKTVEKLSLNKKTYMKEYSPMTSLIFSVESKTVLKRLGIFASDSKQNPGVKSCFNHIYKPKVSQESHDFTCRSPVWLSRYLWLEFKSLKNIFPMVFLTLQSIGGNEYGKTGHSKMFTFLRHFMIILKHFFFKGFNVTPYDRHLLNWTH